MVPMLIYHAVLPLVNISLLVLHVPLIITIAPWISVIRPDFVLTPKIPMFVSVEITFLIQESNAIKDSPPMLIVPMEPSKISCRPRIHLCLILNSFLSCLFAKDLARFAIHPVIFRPALHHTVGTPESTQPIASSVMMEIPWEETDVVQHARLFLPFSPLFLSSFC